MLLVLVGVDVVRVLRGLQGLGVYRIYRRVAPVYRVYVFWFWVLGPQVKLFVAWSMQRGGENSRFLFHGLHADRSSAGFE